MYEQLMMPVGRGQGLVLQGVLSSLGPMQASPDPWGEGLVQDLHRVANMHIKFSDDKIGIVLNC